VCIRDQTLQVAAFVFIYMAERERESRQNVMVTFLGIFSQCKAPINGAFCTCRLDLMPIDSVKILYCKDAHAKREQDGTFSWSVFDRMTRA
jgi:hypothetical protein